MSLLILTRPTSFENLSKTKIDFQTKEADDGREEEKNIYPVFRDILVISQTNKWMMKENDICFFFLSFK